MTATEVAERWKEHDKRLNQAISKIWEPLINKTLEILKRHG